MTTSKAVTRWAAVGLSAALLVAGCASTPQARGHMGGGLAMMGSSNGGMMGFGRHGAGSRCTPPNAPGQTVNVALMDMDMGMMRRSRHGGAHMMLRAAPAAVTAGEVTVVAANMGRRAHELLIMPLSPSARAGQRIVSSRGRVNEARALGEASASCRGGTGEGIKPGTRGWVTVDLPAGRYELICNLRNHYGNGMYQTLTVT